MKEHFEKQLEDNNIVTNGNIVNLSGESIYGKYKVGDKVLSFLEYEENVDDDGNAAVVMSPLTSTFENETIPTAIMTIKTVTERELTKFSEDYKFLRMATDMIPVFEKVKCKQ